MIPTTAEASPRKVRLAYLVSHPIQYQAPLLRRIAQEPGIELTVFFGSDFSLRGYKDEGFGVEVAWDTPLLEGYRSVFLPKLRDSSNVSFASPLNYGIYRHLSAPHGGPAFDALWVHGYASVNSIVAILAAHALEIPVLLRADVWLADRPRGAFKLAVKSLILRMLGRFVAATLPVGSANAAYWSYYFGDDFPQFLLPYAVDNEAITRSVEDAAATEAELRRELHLEPGRPVILYASKLQHRKHCDHLVEAYRALAAEGNELIPYLVIVGDGEERANLEAQCKDLPGVRFAGFQNQTVLPRYFRLADVFVLPARHEPWGLIVNEAMAGGCAVIVSSDVGAGPDLITNGVEGFIYPYGDIIALTAALRQVLANPDTAAAMGRAAKQRISNWSFEEDVQGLHRALQFVTGRARRDEE